MGDSVMNILQGNITKTLIITFILGIVISLVLGQITIPLLRRLKFGQNIREDGPKTHLKLGTYYGWCNIYFINYNCYVYC